jgi:hypothetical protein
MSMPPGSDPNAPYPYQPPSDPGGYGAQQPNLGPSYGPGYDPNAPEQQWQQPQPYDTGYQMSGPPAVDPTTGMPMTSGVPMSTAPMQMPPPPGPPPKKSNTGLIVGLLVGGGALVVVVALVVVFGVFLHARNSAKHKADQIAASASSSVDEPSDSPTPSPTPTSRDLTTLDSSSTDQTPFTQQQIFAAQSVTGDDGTSYALKSAGAFSACTDSGDSSTEALMKAHSCGNMMVGVYSNDTAGLLVSTMVLALPDTTSVTAIKSGLDQKGDEWNGLSYYCPKDAAYYQTVCGSTARRWWGSAVAFHRYLIISMALQESGAAPTGTTQQNDAIDAVVAAVQDDIPAIN